MANSRSNGIATFQVAPGELEARVPDDGPRGWHNRGYLPHFDDGEVTQHVTIRLADSLPANVLETIKEEVDRERDHLGRPLPPTAAELKILHLAEVYLDKGHGECVLRDPRAAEIVQTAFKHFHGIRYHLHQWCVMPNHAHVLFTPAPTEQLGKIVHSWKSFTSNRINALLGLKGQLWMYDYFDRYMRNEGHFNDTCNYILQNPVTAHLCGSVYDWKWSSAQYGGDLEGRVPELGGKAI